jgi:hypothetical protein
MQSCIPVVNFVFFFSCHDAKIADILRFVLFGFTAQQHNLGHMVPKLGR